MSVKNVDFKQLAMNYGERIGLAVGAALMVLLIIWGLTAGPSTATDKEEIKANADKAQKAIQASQVVEHKLIPKDVPPEKELVRRQVAFNTTIPDDAFPLRSPFYQRSPIDDQYRTNPNILTPIEIKATPVHVAVRIRQIVKDQATVIDPDKTLNYTKVKRDKKQDQDALKRFKSFGGDGPGGMGMMGMAGMGGMAGMMGGPRGRFAQKPFKPEDKPKEAAAPEGQLEITTHVIQKKLADLKPEDVIAETLAPVRGVLIVGSFPHRKQMQEIARALKLDESQVPLLYLPGEVQRREIVPKDGRLPNGDVAKQDWATVDLKWVRWLFSLAVELEKESDPLLKALEIKGLVMHLPKPQRGKYPDLAAELKSVQEAKETLEKEAKENAPPPPVHPGMPQEIDPFNPEGGGPEGDKARTGQPKTRKPGEGAGDFSGTPTNSLIRFLDYDPQMRPGLTYEYRLRVVLHNPNFGQHDRVQEARHAESKEIKGPWSTPVLRVTMPEEVHIYADAREIKGIDRDTHKASIQLHKWLQAVRTADLHPVGEWWVEKLMVGRGEYIGRVDKARYIVWVSTAIDPANRTIGVDVFKQVKNDPENLWTGALLVDFETYQLPQGVVPSGGKVPQKFGNRVWQEESPTEILFVDELGRLMAHHQHVDREDPDRTKRFTRWEQWVENVSNTLKGIKKEGSGNQIKFDQ
jgi:hypothetical protein